MRISPGKCPRSIAAPTSTAFPSVRTITGRRTSLQPAWRRRARVGMAKAGLHRFAVATAVATLFLIVAGGLVTSTESGLSVPDWPLSYGRLMPPMVGGVFYEHGHRMVATTVGILTIILAVWLSRREPRAWVRRLGYAA